MTIKENIISAIKEKSTEVQEKAVEKISEQFKKTFEDMSQMISDTQDNQIEMNDNIIYIKTIVESIFNRILEIERKLNEKK